MTRSRTTLLTLAAGIALGASPAAAQDDLPERGARYRLTGQDNQRGAFDGWVEVTPREDAPWEVVRLLRFSEGDGEDLRRGTGEPRGDRLEVTLRPERGAADVVAGNEPGEPVYLTLRWDDDGESARVRELTPDGERRGRIRLAPGERARAEGDPDLGERARELGGELLAVGRDEVRDALHEGYDLSERFGLADYLHVGAGGGVNLLPPEEQSYAQKATLDARPDHVWIQSNVQGGVRVPLRATIPVGEVSVGVGLNAGAKLDYAVTDLYAVPQELDDAGELVEDLKRLGKRSFDLPLDASEARALTPGAERVFDGHASVAVRGSLSIGHDVASVADVARIGASGRVGGFYRLQGDIRIEVRRMLDQTVRVRVTRGKTRSRGAHADALLGATVDEDAVSDHLEPGVEYVDEGILRDTVEGAATDAAAGAIRDALRIRLAVRWSRVTRDEFDVAYRFDLSDRRARAAYERAIRGDLTRAGDLVADPLSGVSEDHRVLELEERTHLGVDLDLSVLLEAGANRDVTLEDLDVRDESGRTHYDVFRFRRTRKWEPPGFLDRDRRCTMTVKAIRRTPHEEEPGGRRESFMRSVRFGYRVEDPSTFKGEADDFRRVLRFVGLDASSELPEVDLRWFRSRYGETRRRLSVGISEAGIRSILAADSDEVMDAYVRAYTAATGDAPRWATPEGRERLRRDHRFHDDTNDDDDFAYRQMVRAEEFVEGLRALSGSGSAEDRAEHMKELAKGADYDLYAIAALVALAPQDTLRLDASMVGDLIRVRDAHRGERAELIAVRDPRGE